MRFLKAILPVVALAVFAPPASGAPGAEGLGDRLFPTLGNGGYDARHYDLGLNYSEASVRGLVKMRAVATQDLSRFNLDYAGDEVRGVWVDGRRAAWRREGHELVITPARAIRRGRSFEAAVSFSGAPYTPAADDPYPIGWFATRDGSVASGQPERTHDIHPVNDHPSDKATYSYTITAPRGVTVAVSGRRTGRRTVGDSTLWSFEMDEPMATQVVQLAVGDLVEVDRGHVHGTRLRDLVARGKAAVVEPTLAAGPDQFRWMLDRAGRYPFDEYGVLAADQFFQYALETQTLTLHPADLFDPEQYPRDFAQTVAVHELAHQWYGNSVAIASFSDLWLAEGPATWYEQEYAAEVFGADFEQYMRDEYAVADQYREQYGPVALPKSNDPFVLFSDNVYGGGALVLFALHEKIGDRVWRALQREWAARYAGRSVTTDEWIAFVNRFTHRNLTGFLRDWLYGTETPSMPGHPDWEIEEAPVATAAAARASVRGLEAFGR